MTPKGKTFDRMVKMVKMVRQMMMEILELRFSWIKARSKSLVVMCCEVVLLFMGVLLSLSSSLSVTSPRRSDGERLVYRGVWVRVDYRGDWRGGWSWDGNRSVEFLLLLLNKRRETLDAGEEIVHGSLIPIGKSIIYLVVGDTEVPEVIVHINRDVIQDFVDVV